MKTKQVFHNPDKLTKKQVGTGYRLLYSHEIRLNRRATKYIHCWLPTKRMWDDKSTYSGASEELTYRISITKSHLL